MTKAELLMHGLRNFGDEMTNVKLGRQKSAGFFQIPEK
jgi:hypothetical protein